jgi:hypothetical protein
MHDEHQAGEVTPEAIEAMRARLRESLVEAARRVIGRAGADSYARVAARLRAGGHEALAGQYDQVAKDLRGMMVAGPADHRPLSRRHERAG